MAQSFSRSRLDRVYAIVARLATWPVIGRLVAAFVLLFLGFQLRSRALGGVPVLDVRFGYTPDGARDVLEALGEAGRSLYVATQLTLDVAFPLVYAALFAALIVRWHDREPARRLLAIPLLGGLMDLLENVTAVILASTYNGAASPLAWVTSAAGIVKFACFATSLLLILAGGISRLSKKK
jgi:hypothetical protein